MPDTTPNELDRVNAEIDQCQAALRVPTVGLFASRKLYRRLEALYRELDSLEKDIPEHERSQ